VKISFVKHKELSKENLAEIINLKNQHWNYSVEQHKDWIQSNIDDDDYHLLLYNDENNLTAYLNMISILIINESEKYTRGLGIGNVCVDKTKKKKGLGLFLMQIANYFINNSEFQGLLLCKESLVPFYKKAGWIVFEKEFSINGDKIQATLMSLTPLCIKFLSVNKNF
jgi:predicted GNAT family N-acyltransferase